MSRHIGVVSVVVLLATVVPKLSASDEAFLSPNEQLGRSIFFDRQLSINRNQSCAECHAPNVGWTGPDLRINKTGAVYEGSIRRRFGNRKPPASAYATPSPIFHYELENGAASFIGGNFWDGRATGEKLGSPAADQAQGPFLNPLEQALPDSACVVHRVCNPRNRRNYPVRFTSVWGAQACDIKWPADVDKVCSQEDGEVVLTDIDRAKVNLAYDNIALSIAAFENSSAVNRFSSKYDAYLAGENTLSKLEKQGLKLFTGKAKCATCHVVNDGPNGEPPLFTDFKYDNIGTPRNPDNPWYEMPSQFNPDGKDWIDPGLGGFLATRDDYAEFVEDNYGKHKVPTLRNVGKQASRNFVKAYGHNGYFKSLKSIVHFYNTRDIKPKCPDLFTREQEALEMNCWPVPEVSSNLNTSDVGDLGLTDREEDAIIAFLKSLSDDAANFNRSDD